MRFAFKELITEQGWDGKIIIKYRKVKKHVNIQQPK